MELSDDELAALHELLWEECDRNMHEPSRVREDDRKILDHLFQRAGDEGKKRKLWWAR